VKRRSVAWRVGAIVLLAVAFSLISHHFTNEAESGFAVTLTSTKVCIRRGGSSEVGCWRIDENTDVRPGVARGDLVTVRRREDLALSVTE
jgi:hypothetical protein